MNYSMFQKILGDIRTRKGRTALVSISIFIGVLGVVTLITAGDLLVKQLKADIQQDALPMVQAYITIPGDAPANLDDARYLDSIRTLPNVDVVEGQANYPFFWKMPDEGRFRESRIQAFYGPFDDVQMMPARLVKGKYPETGNNEIAVEQRMADAFDLKIGDQIDIRILSKTEDLLTEQWTVVGILFHPYSQLPDETMFATYDDASHLGGFSGLSVFVVRYDSFALAEASQDALSSVITEQTPYIVVFSFLEDPAKNSAIEGTEQYASILAALAVVAMLVSGFLVVNVVNNIVVEQKRQIGVLKSLGARRRETFIMYAGIALTYGILGMIPGVLLGIPAGYKMAVIIGNFANTLIDDFAVSPPAIILGVVLGLAVPVFSAVLPVYNGTRVTILEAMTDLGISGGYKVGLIARFIRVLPLPVNIKQSLSNINQKKWRLALTVLTLTLAITAFMGVSAVFIRINDVLQDILDTFGFEVQVQPTQSQSFEEVETLLMENIDGIERVFPGTAIAIQLEGYVSAFTNTSQLLLTGIDTEAELLELDLTEGTAWREDSSRHGIVLTTEVANQVGKSVGDMVTIVAGGKELELEIIGITNFPFDIAFIPWRDLARFAGYTRGAPIPNEYFTGVNLDGYTGALENGQVTAWGIDEQVMQLVEFIDFTMTAPEIPSVMISQALADSSGYAVGDDVTLTIGVRSETYRVAAIFSPRPEVADMAAQTGVDLTGEVIAFEWTTLATLEDVNLDGEPTPNVFLIVAENPDMSAREVDRMIEDINDLLVANGITSSFTNMVEIADQASDAILSIGIILNMASLVMAAVGAIGLFTTLSISVFERQKEIGVMRSVGAGSWTIITQFLVEGILVGLIAWIIAAPLSYGLAYLLTNLLPFGEFIEFAYPPVMLPAGLIGIMVIATISSIWPSVAASRRTVSDILRYQ
ncbi:MAG: ABC transporter permease [Anaerolineae bacterium]|nr:ABC transporter permease [Anaerolineae bacterium]